MELNKAKSLDNVLLEFTGNKTIDWRKITDFKTERDYYLWENDVNVLIGDGLLKKDYQTNKLWLSEKGFGVMTDLNSFGYYKKAKSILFDKIRNMTLLILSILTFLILLFRFNEESSVNTDNSILKASENKKTTLTSEESITKEKYQKKHDSLIEKLDTNKLSQKQPTNKK